MRIVFCWLGKQIQMRLLGVAFPCWVPSFRLEGDFYRPAEALDSLFSWTRLYSWFISCWKKDQRGVIIIQYRVVRERLREAGRSRCQNFWELLLRRHSSRRQTITPTLPILAPTHAQAIKRMPATASGWLTSLQLLLSRELLWFCPHDEECIFDSLLREAEMLREERRWFLIGEERQRAARAKIER